MNIKIKTTFSKARIETFYKFHFLKKSTYKFIELGMVIITFIISLLGITILENLYVFAICLVLGFVMVGTRNYRISSRVKSFLNKNKPDVMPYIIVITDDKIEYIRDNVTTIYTYDKLVEISEIDECFYIYVSENSALIVPKHSVVYEKRNDIRDFFIRKASENENLTFKQYKFISIHDKEGVV